jgi:hypothetical protein
VVIAFGQDPNIPKNLDFAGCKFIKDRPSFIIIKLAVYDIGLNPGL